MTLRPRRGKGPKKPEHSTGPKPFWGEDVIMEVYPKIKIFIIVRLGWVKSEEVIQEAMKAIIRDMNRVTGRNKRQFFSWCFQIARHKMFDFMRDKSGEILEPLAPEEFVKLAEAGVGAVQPPPPGLLSDLKYFLDLLRETKFPCNEVLQYRYLAGLEYEDIAAIYGISKAAARMKIKRCLDDAQMLAKRSS